MISGMKRSACSSGHRHTHKEICVMYNRPIYDRRRQINRKDEYNLFMKKLSLSKLLNWRWTITIMAVITIIGAASFAFASYVGTTQAAPAKARTVTVYIQASDSCAQTLPDVRFTVSGPGVANVVTAPTNGLTPRIIPSYGSAPRAQRKCPWPTRSCSAFNQGCTTAVLPVPAKGTVTFKITPRLVSGQTYLPAGVVVLSNRESKAYQTAAGRNYAYSPCEGGPDCRGGLQVATVTVTSGGKVSASTLNINPDGFHDAFVADGSAGPPKPNKAVRPRWPWIQTTSMRWPSSANCARTAAALPKRRNCFSGPSPSIRIVPPHFLALRHIAG